MAVGEILPVVMGAKNLRGGRKISVWMFSFPTFKRRSTRVLYRSGVKDRVRVVYQSPKVSVFFWDDGPGVVEPPGCRTEVGEGPYVPP